MIFGKFKKMQVQCLSFVMTLVLVLSTFAWFELPAKAAIYYEEGPEIYGEAYCVMDLDTGEILFAHNATEEHYPASITKVLTALVVLEQVEDLDATLTYSEDAVKNVTSNSSTIHPLPVAGEKMSVRNCLYGLMLSSCNISANELAEYTAGSTPEFAKLMNARAKQIGVVNSNFVNAHGLPNDEHYTCAYDMALIFREALHNETFAKIDSTATYTIPATNKVDARSLSMGHKMVNGEIPYEGVFAGKTGRTLEAGRTLLTAAEHNGRRIVVVLMKSTDDTFYLDAQTLLDYAYDKIDGKIAGEWEWQGTEEPQTVTASGNVNIRELPTIHSFAVGTLEKDAKVVRTGYCNNWSRIEKDGKEVYVSSAYLTPLVGNTQEVATSETQTTEEQTTVELTTKEQSKETETSEIAESGTEATSQNQTEASTAKQENIAPGTVDDTTENQQTTSETTVVSTEQIDDQNNQKKNNGDLVLPILLIVTCSVLLILIVVFVVYYIQSAKKQQRRRQMRDRNRY